MSPDGRVVYRISGTVNDVVLNWCGTREEEIALYAEAFHLAGRTLADQFGTTGAISDLEAVPIVYLYRHALELYMKAVILEGAELLKWRRLGPLDTARATSTHRFTELLPDFAAVLDQPEFGWDMGADHVRTKQQFTQVVSEFDQFDPRSESFRYPVRKDGNSSLSEQFAFNIGLYCSTLDPILKTLDGVITGIHVTIEELHEWASIQEASEV